jgi:hypothetical protein
LKVGTLCHLGPEAAAECVKERLAELPGAPHTLIASDENLPGLMPGRGPCAFAEHERLAAALAILARQHELTLAIILREPVAWLTSIYRVHEARGAAATFEAFVESIAPDSLRLPPLLQLFNEVCAGRLKAFAFERIAADSGHEFLRSIAGLGGLAPGRCRPILPHRNKSRPTVLQRPLASPAYLASLSERFAEDRRWVAAHFLPDWKEEGT